LQVLSGACTRKSLLPAPENWALDGVVPAWQYRPDLEPLYPVSAEQAKLFDHAMIAVEIHRPRPRGG
jgi:hypothetical protein